MVAPRSAPDAGEADFVMVSSGVRVALTCAVSGKDATAIGDGLVGAKIDFAFASFKTKPRSISA